MMWVLLKSYFLFQQCKNCKNRLTFDQVITDYVVSGYMTTVYVFVSLTVHGVVDGVYGFIVSLLISFSTSVFVLSCA